VPDTTSARTLVLLRHAKSVRDGTPDADRALASRGHADAAAVGRWFVEAGHEFGLVVCSPATRTRETWADIERAGAVADQVSYDERVYEAEADDLLDVLADVPDETRSVLVVGHSPGIPELVEFLADPERSDSEALYALRRSFPTSCFAVLTLDRGWSDLAGHSADLGEVAAPRG